MALVVIKLGSSIVSDERGDPRVDVIRHVCEETARLHDERSGVVLVTSGAIARGMRVMDLPVRPRAIGELQAASAVGQAKLFRVYEELLSERGVASAQVLLTFFDMSARTHYLNARKTLRTLLDWGVVPVVNENDTTATDEISFGDNDFLAAQIAILLGADRLLILTDIDGLYSADPATDPAARLVPEVGDLAVLDELQIGASASPLGSGGMRSKVVAAEMATAAGIPAGIIDGTAPGPLAAALRGEQVGTRFTPQHGRVSSFKLWLKYAKPSRGRLVVDEGAGRALRERGTSLLPVGIVEVEGEFQPGDAVDVAAPDNGAAPRGRAIGKGIVNYSAAELRRVKGLKTAEVAEVVPRATEEAVHRDYFVLD
jgi:glutamate 5-kinase